MVGRSNTLAHAAAKQVAAARRSDPVMFNPLYIHAGVGLGKTHLMQAIGHAIKRERKEVRLAYVSSERFTNEVINSLRYDRMVSFRDKYRNVDVLLIDSSHGHSQGVLDRIKATRDAYPELQIIGGNVATAAGALALVAAGRLRWAAVALGIAIASKLFPIVAVPVLAVAVWRRHGPRETVITGAILVATLAALFGPFFLIAPQQLLDEPRYHQLLLSVEHQVGAALAQHALGEDLRGRADHDCPQRRQRGLDPLQ